VLYCAVFRRVESLGSKAVTNVVLWVLKHPPPSKQNVKNDDVKFNKRLHGNTQYIQKQTHLLQFLDFV